ncbi:hypothetical protein DV736_g6052, partial [Chaetothyriales sp. CBS 134916]
MEDAHSPPLKRRRSSVAYDPARDIFTEIPDAIPENAVLDSPESASKTMLTAEPKVKESTSSLQGNSRSSPRPAPRTALDLPKVSKRPREEGEAPQSGDTDSRDPSPIRRSPTRQQVHRPGGREGRGRIIDLDQIKRDREARQGPGRGPAPAAPNRGVQDASNQFYNERPDWFKTHGREWRKNDSQIKGLRSFNNFIKSVLIQKFSPEVNDDEDAWGLEDKPKDVHQDPIRVLDIGCGKGGDLGKWDKLPTPVELYVGLDPASTSIQQASQRYMEMSRRRDRQAALYDGRFFVQDCFGESIANLKIIDAVGFDPNVGNGTIRRFGGGGFDVVTMMFSMHYAFESETKVRTMLKNVAGSLKKGGRFIGVVPNSDALADHVNKWFANKKPAANSHNGGDNNDINANKENHSSSSTTADAPAWGNSIYNSYNLEQRYRKAFLSIWEEEKYKDDMWNLAARMGVVDKPAGQVRALPPGDPSVRLAMSDEEREAVGFYHAFCFVKG